MKTLMRLLLGSALSAASACAGISIPIIPLEIAQIIHETPQSAPEHVYQGKLAATSPGQTKRSKSHPTPSPEPSVWAQGDDLHSLGKKADADLTAAYQQCLAQFQTKEPLRIAERAWIKFSDKDEAAAALAGKRRGLSDDDLWREALNEVNARAEQLRSFFLLPNLDLQSCQQQWQAADQQLSDAYQNALSFLSSDEQQKLRESERAWIEYRDKDAKARSGDPSERAPVWSAVVLTRRRVEQLAGFYGRLSSMTVAPTTPTPTPFDPAELVRLQVELHQKAQALLEKASSQGWKGTKFSSLDQFPDIPVDFSHDVSAAADTDQNLQQKLGNQEPSTEYKDDSAAVNGLAVFCEAARTLKSGNAVQADEVTSSFSQRYATARGPNSKWICDAVNSTHALLTRLREDSKTHASKAASEFAAGKAGDAIREYQRAYEIFPDPAIADRIKQLRDESLGL